MNNRDLIRGMFLMAVSLLFGLGSLKYSVGHFTRAGPGMFPLLVSCALFLIGLITILRSRFVEPAPLDFRVKNIVLIILSLGGFVLISKYLNMALGIVFLVFCSSFAATSFSVRRNLAISAGLIIVALIFKKFLGQELPLY